MEIEVNTFYHCRPLYRYMPRPIFDALEAAFKEGREYAEVSEVEFNKMKAEAPAELWPDTPAASLQS